VISATEAELALLECYARDLPMLFIVSEVELRPGPADVDAHNEALPRVTIERASGVRCERCWRYVPKVSTDPEWAGLCERCQRALASEREGLHSSARSSGARVGPRAR
jgi:isoleucyl-tRNA synthetase